MSGQRPHSPLYELYRSEPRFWGSRHLCAPGTRRTVRRLRCRNFCHVLRGGTEMAPESPPASGAPAPSQVVDKGLKKGAIGYVSNIVIGVASTAPAYSLAATLGFIVAVKGVGVHAPAVMLVAFIPMLLVASAYKYFNRADPDAGTTFAWTTRSFGPATGWMNGWAIFLADLIVMASLSDIAAIYTFKLFGFTELGESKAAVIIAAVVWIAIMTWICFRGIELSARIQQMLLSAEVFILGLFSVVAFVKVYGSHPPHGSIKPSLSWINPFAMNFSDLVVALLLAVFIYWGWDSGVAVNEESEDPAEGPGKAAIVSTILLVLIYVVVTAAAQSFHGVGFLTSKEKQAGRLHARLRPALDNPHGRPAAALRKRAGRLAHRDRLSNLLLLRLHRRRLRVLLPSRADRQRAQPPAAGHWPAARRPDAVRDRDQGAVLLRPRRKRLLKAHPRHHAAAVDGHRRHGPRRRDHDRLATILPRLLRAQNRNGAPGPARAAPANRTHAGARRLLAHLHHPVRSPQL